MTDRELLEAAGKAAGIHIIEPRQTERATSGEGGMMDDLVQRLRIGLFDALRTLDTCFAASDRIEQQDAEIERLRAQLAERDRDAERLRSALVELVACKDLKDELTRLRSDPYYVTQADIREAAYERRKPAAWEAARAAVKEGMPR